MASYLTLPTHHGWCVTWETGEVRDRTRRKPDGTRKVIGQIAICDSRYSMDKGYIEKLANDLIKQGFKNVKVSECIF